MPTPKPDVPEGRSLRPGGLMRCCIKTLEDTETQNVEGEKLKCAYCKDGKMRFHAGAWEWDR